MSEKGSKVNLVENDELNSEHESNDDQKESKNCLDNLMKKCGWEFNGLFFIILSIVIFALAITIAMILSIFFGPPQIRPHAGISTEVKECTNMGLDICRHGGSAVDSAIASLICISIVRPDITGLGGCGSMLIHNHTSMKSRIIDFSCQAPPTAKAGKIKTGFGIIESVAIPGVFSGIKLAHTTYGKMNWTTLMQFVINQLNNGVAVTPQMTTVFTSKKFSKLPSSFRSLYQSSGSAGVFKPSANLSNLLSIIQNEGYITGISGSISKEINNVGFAWDGLFDNAKKQKPLTAVFGDYSLFTAPLPSKGGLDLAIALELLNKVVPLKALEKETTLFYHRLLEALKVAQASTSFLGSSDSGKEPTLLSPAAIQNLLPLMGVSTTYPNQNYGPYSLQSNIESGSGTHITVVDSNSLYVSLSVNLGSQFGSGISTQSGILLNDALRLFTPNDNSNVVAGLQNRTTTSNNMILPGKKPLNQLVPLMVYNFKRKCGVRFAVGGDHGSRSTTGNLQMIMSAIYLDQRFCPSKDCMDLPKAGLRPRLHLNIVTPLNNNPNATAMVYYDQTFPLNFQAELTTIYKHSSYNISHIVHSLNSIGKVQYEIQGFSNSLGGTFVSF